MFEAVGIINLHKHSSICAALDADQYRRYFGKRFQRLSMSAYGMCFVLCVYMNHLTAQHNNFSGSIHYALDSGNTAASHIEGAREGIVELQNAGSFFHMGGVTFCDDEQAYELQAADIVAWAGLRYARGLPFDKELEPLRAIFDNYHITGDPGNLVPKLADQLKGFDLS